jgi:hypothetical protein
LPPIESPLLVESVIIFHNAATNRRGSCRPTPATSTTAREPVRTALMTAEAMPLMLTRLFMTAKVTGPALSRSSRVLATASSSTIQLWVSCRTWLHQAHRRLDSILTQGFRCPHRRSPHRLEQRGHSKSRDRLYLPYLPFRPSLPFQRVILEDPAAPAHPRDLVCRGPLECPGRPVVLRDLVGPGHPSVRGLCRMPRVRATRRRVGRKIAS